MNEVIDFENEDFWKQAIKRSVAKRMIKRGHDYAKTIRDICCLEIDEVKNLIELDKSFIKSYDLEKRQEYLFYYRGHKYEDWECKRIIDLNEIDVYEICEGKGQSIHLDFENIIESDLIGNGEKIAKNLALIEMAELNYPKKDIEAILGDDETETIRLYPFMISKEVVKKMENHFKNIGINSKRYEILLSLLTTENSIGNASRITGLTRKEVDEYISNNRMFKSDDDKSILDADKVKREMDLWNSELLVECLAINGMEDYHIDDFCELSGMSEDCIKRIYELHKQFKPKLNDLQSQMAKRLMDNNFEYDEIEEIVGIGIYDAATDLYYLTMYKECLSNERRRQ